MANTVSPDVFDGADDVSVGVFVFVGVFVGGKNRSILRYKLA